MSSTCSTPTRFGTGAGPAIGRGSGVGVGETGFWVAVAGGVGAGVGVGIARIIACTRASTVASIFGVGTGLGNAAAIKALTVASISTVGTGVVVGASIGVGIGDRAAQASPVKPRTNKTNAKERVFMASSCATKLYGFVYLG